jgi:hypothetical protein
MELVDDSADTVQPFSTRALELTRHTAIRVQRHTQREPVAVVSALRVALVIGCLASRMSIEKMIPTILAAEAVFTTWTRGRVSPTAHRVDRRAPRD